MIEINEFMFMFMFFDEINQLVVCLVILLEVGDVLLFEGDLGVGKIIFIKSLVKGLGIECNVNSLIFMIIKEYKSGCFFFYYMDVYCLGDEFEDLGFDEYFEGDGVMVVEWVYLIEEQFFNEYI